MLKEIYKKDNSGIYYHKSPASCKLYDSIWTEQYDFSNIQKERTPQDISSSVFKLLNLFFPSTIAKNEIKNVLHTFKDKSVLDVCAGHANASLAASDLLAEKVYVCDGSKKSLESLIKKIESNSSYRKYEGKLIAVQSDVELIDEVFIEKSFDIVFQKYAVHHVRNPAKMIYQLANLVKPGGLLSFNYFTTGCTSLISRELRKFFLTKNVDYIKNFFIFIDRLKSKKGPEAISELKKILEDNSNLDFEFFEAISFLKNIALRFGYEKLSNHLHFEDANTPYLHNMDRKIITKFVLEDLGLSLIDEKISVDEHSMTLKIPEFGVRNPFKIPEIHEYSDEDVALGDSLIQLLNLK